MTKPPVARKLAVGQLVFWLLVVSSLNYFKMHAWSTSMLLLLHFAFMLSVVKLLLKEEVGVCALNSHGNYIVDHGIVFFEFLWEPIIINWLHSQFHDTNVHLFMLRFVNYNAVPL